MRSIGQMHFFLNNWMRHLRNGWKKSAEGPTQSVKIENCLKEFFDSVAIQGRYSVHVSSSSLLNAGNGVFSGGKIRKHQLVSFYPGFYFPPPPLHSIMTSTGENCVKASEIATVNSIYRITCPTKGGALDSTSFPRPSLPFCCGDIVNHPPRGKLPNVFPLDFSWKDVWNDSESWSIESRIALKRYMTEVNKLGKGIWYIDGEALEPIYLPSSDQCSDIGIAIISICDIDDNAELFMDYKFNPKEPAPPWYFPLNYNKIHESSRAN